MQKTNYILPTFLLFALLPAAPVSAQTKDTIITTHLDYRMRAVSNAPGYSYIEKIAPSNGQWNATLFDAANNSVVRRYSYSAMDRKELTGTYLAYHANGSLSDSGTYANNKREGIFVSWFNDGKKSSVYRYKNGITIDSGFSYYSSGSISIVQYTDSEGNGKRTEYYENGAVRATGILKTGRRDGAWRYADELGAPLMDVIFLRDSIVQANCPDQAAGPCIYEKEASFPGGLQGWRQFLERNFRYPKEAISADIQGIVRVKFRVDTDGSLSDMDIVTSPSPILSDEVLRLMKKSPPWEPAIQLNRKVKMWHVQPVVFALQ